VEVLYEGSVKTVYQDSENPSVNYFSFSDDYSIFDWGKMPDAIANKGKALSILGGTFFHQLAKPEGWRSLATDKSLARFDQRFFSGSTYQTLCESGLHHHFLGWTDTDGSALTENQLNGLLHAPLMKVLAVEVVRPRTFLVDQQTLFDYDVNFSNPFLIPLEVVFRFGMPQGSSLNKRLDSDPHYYAELGLSEPPVASTFFERPVIEFFTKLEPKDRFLPVQEAFLMSGLTQEQFVVLYDTALLCALWLYAAFAAKGIELWDGKFEFAWTAEGLMMVDSIGPDEVRLIYRDVHLSKEAIRQFYRGTPWEIACQKAKQESGADWKKICPEQPLPLEFSQKRVVNNLYGTILNHYLNSSIIPTQMFLDEVVVTLQEKQLIGA